MVRKGQWNDYENGKKKEEKEYGEFVRKAREFVCSQPAPPIYYYNTCPKEAKPNKNDPRALVVLQAVASKYCLICKVILLIMGVEALQNGSGGQASRHITDNCVPVGPSRKDSCTEKCGWKVAHSYQNPR